MNKNILESEVREMTELAEITLYNIDDLCRFLDISKFTANKLCRERRIKAIKVGKKWKITKEALEVYLKLRRG